jgi:REP element-mobilizing transposase RayT
VQGNSGDGTHGAMPRGPRLDAPGGLHHVRARGSARQRLFQEDADRADFVQRLARVAEAEALRVYAWALLPTHCHLLVRTGRHPLARSMRALLTGYAGSVSRNPM